jgi:hypothetical protein
MIGKCRDRGFAVWRGNAAPRFTPARHAKTAWPREWNSTGAQTMFRQVDNAGYSRHPAMC